MRNEKNSHVTINSRFQYHHGYLKSKNDKILQPFGKKKECKVKSTENIYAEFGCKKKPYSN